MAGSVGSVGWSLRYHAHFGVCLNFYGVCGCGEFAGILKVWTAGVA